MARRSLVRNALEELVQPMKVKDATHGTQSAGAPMRVRDVTHGTPFVSEPPVARDDQPAVNDQRQWEHKGVLAPRLPVPSQFEAEGWELVSVIPQPGDQAVFYFKRRRA